MFLISKGSTSAFDYNLFLATIIPVRYLNTLGQLGEFTLHCNINMVWPKRPTDFRRPFLGVVINQSLNRLLRFNFSNLLTSIQTKR